MMGTMEFHMPVRDFDGCYCRHMVDINMTAWVTRQDKVGQVNNYLGRKSKRKGQIQ